MTIVNKETGYCPNWIYIDIIHGVTDGETISWTDTLNEFIKDLYDALYVDDIVEQFYVSLKADCQDRDEYIIGSKIIDDAKRVWLIEGYTNGNGHYFYDKLYEYEI